MLLTPGLIQRFSEEVKYLSHFNGFKIKYVQDTAAYVGIVQFLTRTITSHFYLIIPSLELS